MATTRTDAYTWDATRMKWQGRWNEFKGRSRQVWGHLTNDLDDVAEGKFDEYMGRLQAKTGKTGEELEREINEEV